MPSIAAIFDGETVVRCTGLPGSIKPCSPTRTQLLLFTCRHLPVGQAPAPPNGDRGFYSLPHPMATHRQKPYASSAAHSGQVSHCLSVLGARQSQPPIFEAQSRAAVACACEKYSGWSASTSTAQPSQQTTYLIPPLIRTSIPKSQPTGV